MPFKDKRIKAAHNKTYKNNNSELLTIQRIIQLKQKTITQQTYDHIKSFVEDESFWENVTVRKSIQKNTKDKITLFQQQQQQRTKEEAQNVIINPCTSPSQKTAPNQTTTTLLQDNYKAYSELVQNVIINPCTPPSQKTAPNQTTTTLLQDNYKAYSEPLVSIEKPGYIYLICEREFLKTNEKIYKIGKTINIKHRMPQYPKDSRLYLCFYCTTNIDTIERNLISSFNLLFIKRSDIGAEYYEGDVTLMIRHMIL